MQCITVIPFVGRHDKVLVLNNVSFIHLDTYGIFNDVAVADLPNNQQASEVEVE